MMRRAPLAIAVGILTLAFCAKQALPSSTAEGVAVTRVLLSRMGLLSEGIAASFFPFKAWVFSSLPPSLRNAFLRSLLPGGASHLATRTWFYDEHIMRLLKPDMQVVICGAGFDSRAYRLHVPRGVRFFELDLATHPGVQEYKRGQLARHGIVIEQVTHLPIDFKTQSIADVLEAGGHDARRPTIFLWEGVTMYLSEAAVAATVGAMRSRAAPGSYLLCELFSAHLLSAAGHVDPLLAPYWKLVNRSGEPYSFGVWPSDMRSFWSKLSAQVLVHYTPEEQREEWAATPGVAPVDDGGAPHGGICHLFLLELQ
jgi:methyltransferase (TIGR00027 family)